MQASPGLLYISTPSKVIEKVIKEFLINDENDKKLPKIKKFYKEVVKYHEVGNLENHPIRIKEKEWEKSFSI
jgi:hypothetical protein